jgi:hypothetical protein
MKMNEDQPASEDRFGFTEDQIVTEVMAHEGMIRDGCYVPTRHEVATWPAARLNWHLLGWWWESPSSLIPNDDQIAECVAVLRARRDADSHEIKEIIAQAPSPSSGAEEEGTRAEDGSNEGEGESD